MLIRRIGNGPLLQFHGIIMALPADFGLWPIEQLGCFAAMRIMTVQAGGAVRQRPMDLLFGIYTVDHGLVTLQA